MTTTSEKILSEMERMGRMKIKDLCAQMDSQSSRIAAYKLGFDYVGCELDKEYFDKGCERFDRECHGIYVNADGSKVQQQTLFFLPPAL